jgi:hypothetical protein
MSRKRSVIRNKAPDAKRIDIEREWVILGRHMQLRLEISLANLHNGN